jgi:hypothetical protein
MSNIFNENETKSIITDFLGAKYSSKIAEAIPRQYVTPDSKSLMNSLKDHPNLVPKGAYFEFLKVGVPTTDYFEQEVIESFNMPENISLPHPPETRSQAFYRGPMLTGRYDEKLFKQMLFRFARKELTMYELKLAKDAITENFYGTGTVQGQISRLSVMDKLSRGVPPYSPRKTLSELGYTIHTAAKLLERTLPVLKDQTMMPLSYWPIDYLDLATREGPRKGYYLTKIKKSSSAGQPYSTKKKGDVITESVAIAQEFMIALSSVIKGEELASMLFKNFWYLYTYNLFPKMEVYARSKALTNTRNIWIEPLPTLLLTGQISTTVSDFKVNATNRETPSLYGFSPYHGGMHIMMDKFLNTKKHQYYIYADNIYILYWDESEGDHTYYSIDLEKGEANAFRETVTAMAYYYLNTTNHVQGVPEYNKTWAHLALSILPIMTCDSPLLTGPYTLKTPGQKSGNRYTFENNHLISSIICDLWEKQGHPRPGSREWDEFVRGTGFNAKIELELGNLSQKVKAHVSTKQEERLPIKIDLLGYSTMYIDEANSFWPVLDEERLFKSAMFPKREVSNVSIDTELNAMCYDLIRYQALMFAGLWCYPGTLQCLKFLSNNIRNKPGVLEAIENATIEGSIHSDLIDDYILQSIITKDFSKEALIELNSPVDSQVEGEPESMMTMDPTLLQSCLTLQSIISELSGEAPESNASFSEKTRTQKKNAKNRKKNKPGPY